MIYKESIDLSVDGSLNHTHPLSLAIVFRKDNTFHFYDAMQKSDREQFIETMLKELKDHQANRH